MIPFTRLQFYSFAQQRIQLIIKEIEGKAPEFILSVSKKDYIDELYNTFCLIPLEIDPLLKPYKKEHTKGYDRHVSMGTMVQVSNINEHTVIKVSYRFTGTKWLLDAIPENPEMGSYEVEYDSTNSILVFPISVRSLGNPNGISEYSSPEEEYNKKLENAYREAFLNLPKVNAHAENFNSELKQAIERIFDKKYNLDKEKDNFLSKIGIKVNPQTEDLYETKPISPSIIPKVNVENKTKTEIETLSNVLYSDIIRIINIVGEAMERKPSLYVNKDEEHLRDVFLLFLETRYDNVAGVGEAFNKKGSTDILLKDSKKRGNLFIAEMKFWGGEKTFNDAIEQLFDNYITWRDTKTALVFFVKEKNISAIIEKMNQFAKSHNYYSRYISETSKGSFAYEFHLPDDKNSIIQLELIAFHFDVIKTTQNKKIKVQKPLE